MCACDPVLLVYGGEWCDVLLLHTSTVTTSELQRARSLALSALGSFAKEKKRRVKQISVVFHFVVVFVVVFLFPSRASPEHHPPDASTYRTSSNKPGGCYRKLSPTAVHVDRIKHRLLSFGGNHPKKTRRREEKDNGLVTTWTHRCPIWHVACGTLT
ncbi:hypothetical protein BC827DRAFT_706903 [Russula dissimulans]|nr:hypothetical protein BC827DRAFT_706903 [Russula dissimulans]